MADDHRWLRHFAGDLDRTQQVRDSATWLMHALDDFAKSVRLLWRDSGRLIVAAGRLVFEMFWSPMRRREEKEKEEYMAQIERESHEPPREAK